MITQALIHIRIVCGDSGMKLRLGVAFAVVAGDLRPVDRNVLDLALIGIGKELGERDVLLLTHSSAMDDKLP